MWSMRVLSSNYSLTLAYCHIHSHNHLHGIIFLYPTGLGHVPRLGQWNEGRRDDISVLRLGLRKFGPRELLTSALRVIRPGSYHSSSLSRRIRCTEHTWTRRAIWSAAPPPACRSSEQAVSEEELIVAACCWDFAFHSQSNTPGDSRSQKLPDNCS